MDKHTVVLLFYALNLDNVRYFLIHCWFPDDILIFGAQNIMILVQCVYSVKMNLTAKYFIDFLMIWKCLVILMVINRRISFEVTILDGQLAYKQDSIISHLNTQK